MWSAFVHWQWEKKMYSHRAEHFGGFPIMVNRIAMWPRSFTPSYIPKRQKAGTQDIRMPTFIAELFIIAKRWRYPRYPLTDE
jgi:hypothetical protein